MKPRAFALPLVAALAVLPLAACGSSGSSGANPSTSAARPTGGGGGGVGRTQRPGASGLIAAISGQTMQVQNTSSQTAVTWNASTQLAKVVSGTFADVTVGSCVQVRAATVPAGGATSSGGDTAAPTALDAATVSITAPVNGSCAPAGAATPGGNRPTGTRTGGPNGTRTGAPGGAPTGDANGLRGGGIAFGTVTSVSGNSFVVQETGFGRGGSGTASPTGSTPTTVTVTTSPSTSYSHQVAATATDIAVGGCVTAYGTADDTGAITAQSLTLRAPVDGSCTGTGTRPGSSPTNG